MIKIFRFKYEPCLGTCYTGPDDFYQELKQLSPSILTDLVNKLVQAHDSTCDDEDQQFGVDYDEINKLYIANFLNNKELNLFSGKTFLEVANTLSMYVLEVNKNRIIKADACIFGINGKENLKELILNAVKAA